MPGCETGGAGGPGVEPPWKDDDQTRVDTGGTGGAGEAGGAGAGGSSEATSWTPVGATTGPRKYRLGM